MTSPLADPRYAEITFDRDAVVLTDTSDTVRDDPTITDVLVLAHGWNNNAEEARDLFAALIAGVRGQLDAHPAPDVRSENIGFLGVVWPSKRFDDPDLIPGGAASAGGPVAGAVERQLRDLASELDGSSRRRVEDAATRVGDVDRREDARREVVESLIGVVAELTPDPDDGFVVRVDGVDAQTLGDIAALGEDDVEAPPDRSDDGGAAGGPEARRPGRGGPDGVDGEAGGATGFGVGSLLHAVRDLANVTTFYVMKDRAGRIGHALAPALAGFTGTAPRVHLVGHSFGARLITATALRLTREGPTVGVRSLSMLQAAFSHFALAQDWQGDQDGAFRDVLTGSCLTGPVAITHTANDKAVGIAYALASRLRNQVASAVGDENDPFGGLGRNGAQRTPEVSAAVTTLLPPGQPYDFAPRAVHNLLADAVISDHSDIRGPEVAWAVAHAIVCGARSTVPFV